MLLVRQVPYRGRECGYQVKARKTEEAERD
jgi:hypothetical protein